MTWLQKKKLLIWRSFVRSIIQEKQIRLLTISKMKALEIINLWYSIPASYLRNKWKWTVLRFRNLFSSKLWNRRLMLRKVRPKLDLRRNRTINLHARRKDRKYFLLPKITKQRDFWVLKEECTKTHRKCISCGDNCSRRLPPRLLHVFWRKEQRSTEKN